MSTIDLAAVLDALDEFPPSDQPTLRFDGRGPRRAVCRDLRPWPQGGKASVHPVDRARLATRSPSAPSVSIAVGTGAGKRRLAGGDNLPPSAIVCPQRTSRRRRSRHGLTGPTLRWPEKATSAAGHPAERFLAGVGLVGRLEASLVLGKFEQPWWPVEEVIRLTQAAEADRQEAGLAMLRIGGAHKTNLEDPARGRLEAAQETIAALSARVAALEAGAPTVIPPLGARGHDAMTISLRVTRACLLHPKVAKMSEQVFPSLIQFLADVNASDAGGCRRRSFAGRRHGPRASRGTPAAGARQSRRQPGPGCRLCSASRGGTGTTAAAHRPAGIGNRPAVINRPSLVAA